MENLKELLKKALIHVKATAGAEHILDGFNRRHRPIDDFVAEIEEALGAGIELTEADSSDLVDCSNCSHFRSEGASMEYPYPTAWCGEGKGDIRPDELLLECDLFEKRQMRRCPKCKSSREAVKCWKCGEATFEPCEGWEEPKMPPIDRIRELAREVGYAIGEHGSKERDLDVIAAPWTDDAVGNHDLFQHIAKGLEAKIVSVERKPLGRYAATIQMDGFYKGIDISVCPILKKA